MTEGERLEAQMNAALFIQKMQAQMSATYGLVIKYEEKRK